MLQTCCRFRCLLCWGTLKQSFGPLGAESLFPQRWAMAASTCVLSISIYRPLYPALVALQPLRSSFVIPAMLGFDLTGCKALARSLPERPPKLAKAPRRQRPRTPLRHPHPSQDVAQVTPKDAQDIPQAAQDGRLAAQTGPMAAGVAQNIQLAPNGIPKGLQDTKISLPPTLLEESYETVRKPVFLRPCRWLIRSACYPSPDLP